MSESTTTKTRNRTLRVTLAAVLVVALVIGVFLVWPTRKGHTIVGYFTSAVGLYPGDEVRIVGVPVGEMMDHRYKGSRPEKLEKDRSSEELFQMMMGLSIMTWRSC